MAGARRSGNNIVFAESNGLFGTRCSGSAGMTAADCRETDKAFGDGNKKPPPSSTGKQGLLDCLLCCGGGQCPPRWIYLTINGTTSRATMLTTLITGFKAGPAVSLYGSPTVSPVTAAL